MANRETKIREKKIRELIAIASALVLEIIKEIESGVFNGRIKRFALMSVINKQIEQASEKIFTWVKREMPQYYLDGSNIAMQDLKALKVDMVRTQGSSLLDKDAIDAIVSDTTLSFAESMKAVSRSSRRIIDAATKQQINAIMAEGRLQSATRKIIADAISKRLQEKGISALVDKAGKNWQLDTYTDMLVRTKAVEARNQGMANRMLSYGYDLVQVSSHGSTHPACAKWEGEILSMTGKTAGYSTVEDAKSEGLFHPNCEHAINVIVPELAQDLYAKTQF